MSNYEIKMDLIKHIGTFGSSDSGWTKEVNIISWNNRGAKVDIRSWNPEKTKSSKIATMTVAEAMKLGELLIGLDDGVIDLEDF